MALGAGRVVLLVVLVGLVLLVVLVVLVVLVMLVVLVVLLLGSDVWGAVAVMEVLLILVSDWEGEVLITKEKAYAAVRA